MGNSMGLKVLMETVKRFCDLDCTLYRYVSLLSGPGKIQWREDDVVTCHSICIGKVFFLYT